MAEAILDNGQILRLLLKSYSLTFLDQYNPKYNCVES